MSAWPPEGNPHHTVHDECPPLRAVERKFAGSLGSLLLPCSNLYTMVLTYGSAGNSIGSDWGPQVLQGTLHGTINATARSYKEYELTG